MRYLKKINFTADPTHREALIIATEINLVSWLTVDKIDWVGFPFMFKSVVSPQDARSELISQERELGGERERGERERDNPKRRKTGSNLQP